MPTCLISDLGERVNRLCKCLLSAGFVLNIYAFSITFRNTLIKIGFRILPQLLLLLLVNQESVSPSSLHGLLVHTNTWHFSNIMLATYIKGSVSGSYMAYVDALQRGSRPSGTMMTLLYEERTLGFVRLF